MPGAPQVIRRRRLSLAILGLACVASACTDPAGAELSIDPIQIDSVDVLILETSPPQATAHVEGVIGDGCSALHSTTQRRSANTVTITILRQRPRGAICTQIARLYAEDIPLEGDYPPGHYLLRVNDYEKAFTTQ
jgi:hypothetical protein